MALEAPAPVPAKAPVQVKKKRARLIVGLLLGFMVLDALVIGGSLTSQSMRDRDSSAEVEKSTTTGTPAQGGSGQGSASGNTSGSGQAGTGTGTAGDGEGSASGSTPGSVDKNLSYYADDPLGISLSIPDDWSTSENEGLPDEILRLYYQGYQGTSIWIDRFPSARLEGYLSRYEMFLPYELGMTGTVRDIELNEEVSINGRTWERYVFTMETSSEMFYIDLYLVDAPSNRGVISYAAVISLTGTGGSDLPGYDDALSMLDSLQFTR